MYKLICPKCDLRTVEATGKGLTHWYECESCGPVDPVEPTKKELEEQDLKEAEELFYEMNDDPEAAFYRKNSERREQ